MTYLICYDITDNKRRAKVFSILEKNGLKLQRSVFLIDLNSNQYILLKNKLINSISNNDIIVLLPICQNYLTSAQYIGQTNEKTIVI
jgi:CRISPR-associated protein Cas2